MEPEYHVTRCRDCKVQVVWDKRDRLTWGWFHGVPGPGCKHGQYLDPEHVETIPVEPKT